MKKYELKKNVLNSMRGSLKESTTKDIIKEKENKKN